MLFARLSVFAGGCTIEAAEAMCGGWELGDGSRGSEVTPPTPISQRSTSTLDGLESLAYKSLLQQTHGHAGEPRFGMLETIREYALEQLALSDEWAAIRRQHATVFLALAETAAAALEGADQAAWLARLQQEHDNVRAALGWAIEQGEAAISLRFASALRLFWFMRGYLTEGRERLAQILALGAISKRDHAQALDCAGFLARYQGDYTTATRLISESLAIWRTLGHTQGVADSLSNLGYVMQHQSNYPAARALYEESLGLNHAGGNQQGRADCLSHLGAAAFYQGDAATAQQLHEESLAIWRALGDIEGSAYALYHLGDVALSQADQAAAARWFNECLTASVELGWPWGIVSAIEGAAGLAAARRRSHAALRLAGFAAQLRTTVAIPLSPAREQMLSRRLESARRMLEATAAAAAWAAGEGLASEQAVEDAFVELAASTADGAIGGEPPERSPEEAGGLTTREREVVALIAEGHSNNS
jgi:tetratricopeptide (TPR) repeat protein